MHATAFIIGADEHCSAGLMDLSMDIGFQSVVSFTNLALAEQQIKRTPICYFLFALTKNVHNVPGNARAIRTSRNRQIKFAPMIGFTENAEPRMVRASLQLGFDDIIVPPFNARIVMPRIQSHLNHRINFYETAHYFGPDRRVGLGIHKEREDHPDRGKGGEHRKILINRSLESGISILKDEFHKDAPSQRDDGKSIAI